MNVFFENQDITQIKSFTGRSMASISPAHMATFSWFWDPTGEVAMFGGRPLPQIISGISAAWGCQLQLPDSWRGRTESDRTIYNLQWLERVDDYIIYIYTCSSVFIHSCINELCMCICHVEIYARPTWKMWSIRADKRPKSPWRREGCALQFIQIHCHNPNWLTVISHFGC